MALAQDTELLLLDEPTTYLDVAHQVEMLDLLLDLNRARGTTVVMVLHDLNLAARYADHLVAMCDGRIVAEGAPSEVVTEETVRAVFGLGNRVITDPVSRTPLVVPLGRHHGTDPEGTVLMTMTTSHALPMILAEVEAVRVERLSPTYVRVELGGPELADFGVDGPLYDQRIKLVFPNDAGDAAVLRRSRRVVVRDLARDPRRASAATCGPTPSATSSAAAPTPGWSWTSCCTSRTARRSPGSTLGRAGACRGTGSC